MKKTIYISGPITDNATGQPREGWQKKFMEAEKKLRQMGYGTINPVDIAEETEREWSEQRAAVRFDKRLKTLFSGNPSRSTYITACLNTMNEEYLVGRLHGMYLIGDGYDIARSHGVQMEMRMAKVLGIPVFYEGFGDKETCIDLQRAANGLRLCDGGKFEL